MLDAGQRGLHVEEDDSRSEGEASANSLGVGDLRWPCDADEKDDGHEEDDWIR